jgi:hypothetical protein
MKMISDARGEVEAPTIAWVCCSPAPLAVATFAGTCCPKATAGVSVRPSRINPRHNGARLEPHSGRDDGHGGSFLIDKCLDDYAPPVAGLFLGPERAQSAGRSCSCGGNAARSVCSVHSSEP